MNEANAIPELPDGEEEKVGHGGREADTVPDFDAISASVIAPLSFPPQRASATLSLPSSQVAGETVTVLLTPALARFVQIQAAARNTDAATYLRQIAEEERQRSVRRRIRDLLVAGTKSPQAERSESDWELLEATIREKIHRRS
jgi:hypothetical protein